MRFIRPESTSLNKANTAKAVTTPMADAMVKVLGLATVQHGVALTHDEARHVESLYDGGRSEVYAAATTDGIRILAWLAKHIEPGEDPLRMVIRMCIDTGLDVDPEDAEYAEEGIDDSLSADDLNDTMDGDHESALASVYGDNS